MRKLLLIGALCFALLVPMESWSITFSVTDIDPGTPNPSSTNIVSWEGNTSNFSFNLFNLGDTFTRTDAFRVYIREDGDVNSDYSGTIDVTIDFTTPAGITDSIVIGGVFYDNRTGADRFTVNWTPTTTGWTGSGNLLLLVSLENLDINIGDISGGADWWYTNIDADFELVEATANVPEPATMLLLGSGLLGMGLFGRRRFRK